MITFGPKRKDVTGGRKLYNDLRKFYSSPNISRVTKYMRRWAWHIART